MKRTAIALLIVLSSYYRADAQGWIKRNFPYTVITTQYAGSTGFLSIGASKASRQQKLELGVLYGTIPKFIGSVNRSVSLKLNYSPVRLHMTKKISVQPVMAGIFVCQNFNENLKINWGEKYPKGYYWWSRSTRAHVFLASQLFYKIDKKNLNSVALYFEANTNDLYLYSYFPNTKSMRFTDIVFFGTGIKFYLQ